MVDFDLDESFWRGVFRFLGRALLLLLELLADLFTFWEPWEKKRARRKGSLFRRKK